MNIDYLIYWLWLSNIRGIGPVTAKLLLEKYNDPKIVYEADLSEICSIRGIGKATAGLIVNNKDLSKANKILEDCIKGNIKILTYYDKLYPNEAKQAKAPIVLYYKGELRENSIGVSIIGSRRCSDYGKRVTIETAEVLARNNIAVISGMAKGIDGYAHTACLKIGGYTIAVLGCGVDICYPKEHLKLMDQIIQKSAVISSLPPGTSPDAMNFPKRNYIISMFSKKILVIEAGEKSGSLITAGYGMKMNREIFAVPNSIYAKGSEGCNKLIFNGAKIYLSPNQLINEMNKYNIEDEKKSTDYKVKLQGLELEIVDALSKYPSSLDKLAMILDKDKLTIEEALFELEMNEVITSNGGVLKVK